MCKITFSHIIQENALRRGLFQLQDDGESFFTRDNDLSTESPEGESQVESLEDVKSRRSEQIQIELEKWFSEKEVFLGNPEELVYRHIERQKAIILPNKGEVMGLSGNKMRMNNLLSRRTAKLLEVNVSGWVRRKWLNRYRIGDIFYGCVCFGFVSFRVI